MRYEVKFIMLLGVLCEVHDRKHEIERIFTFLKLDKCADYILNYIKITNKMQLFTRIYYANVI